MMYVQVFFTYLYSKQLMSVLLNVHLVPLISSSASNPQILRHSLSPHLEIFKYVSFKVEDEHLQNKAKM